MDATLLILSDRCSMYLEKFIEARSVLRKQGLDPLLWQGKPLSEKDLDAVDQRTDYSMPAELRRFHLEMGDGFEFIPNDDPETPLDGWTRNCLHDYATWNKGFHMAIEEEAEDEIASSRPRADPRLLQEEVERRKKWIPFYGFNGAGNVLCLDAEGKVRFYEAASWVALPQSWDLVLADSFTDFVEKWSRYCFVAPGSGSSWDSFLVNHSSSFDWSPSHFPRGFDRTKF